MGHSLRILLFFFLLAGCASQPAAQLPAEAAPSGGGEFCPKAGEEPLLKVKTAAGPEISLCGFEDHEVVSPNGKRAFSDFVVAYTVPGQPQQHKLFSSQVAETFWITPVDGKGIELEEVWFFAEQPKPAIWHEVTCDATACQVSDAKCVFNMKPNPFPKALKEFEKKKKSNQLEETGEELLDQIWAQALLGDNAAQTFYQGSNEGLDENLTEVFDSNKAKLADLKNLNCRR